jgi:peroxiredoxin
MSDEYNYDAFDAKHYELLDFKGPRIGDVAPDFIARGLDGREVRLSDYRGPITVLEMGSITCPIYQTRVKGMHRLASEFPDCRFLVLYVREAHPGANVCQHKGDADKLAAASELSRTFHENREILVDDIDGTAHRLYGGMPNSVFIIDGGGRIAFRSDWNDVSATKKALTKLQNGESAGAVRSYFKPASPAVGRTVFQHAGKGSAKDFFGSLPTLIRQNLLTRNLRELFSGSRAP